MIPGSSNEKRLTDVDAHNCCKSSSVPRLRGSPACIHICPGSYIPQMERYEPYDCLSAQVFVKNMPRNRTEENVRTMFSKYGSVFEIHEHPSRTEVTYVVSVVAMEMSYTD